MVHGLGIPQNISIALQQQINAAKVKEGFPLLQSQQLSASSSDEEQSSTPNANISFKTASQPTFINNRMVLSQQQLQQLRLQQQQFQQSQAQTQGNILIQPRVLTPSTSNSSNSVIHNIASISSQCNTTSLASILSQQTVPISAQSNLTNLASIMSQQTAPVTSQPNVNNLASIMAQQTTQSNIISPRVITTQITPPSTQNEASTTAENTNELQKSTETEATVFKLTTPGTGTGESFFVQFKDYSQLREEKNRQTLKMKEFEENTKQLQQLNASLQKENTALTAESREKLGIALNEVKKAYEVEKALKVEKSNVEAELENSQRVNQSLNAQITSTGKTTVQNPQNQPGYQELFSANQNRLAEIAQLHQVIEQLNQQMGEMQKKIFEQNEKLKEAGNFGGIVDDGTLVSRYQEMVQTNQQNVAQMSQLKLVIDRITRENEMWSKKVKEVEEKSKKLDEKPKLDVETKKKLETALNEVRTLAMEKSKLQTILAGIKKSNAVTLNSMSVKIQNLKESNKVLHEINTTIKKEKETLTEKCAKQEKYLKKFHKASETGKPFKLPDENQEPPKESEQSKKVIRTLNKQLADLLKKNFDLGVKIKELEKKGSTEDIKQEVKKEEKVDSEAYFRQKSKEANEDMKTLEDKLAEELERGLNETKPSKRKKSGTSDSSKAKDNNAEDSDEEMANFDDEGISIDPETGEIINTKEKDKKKHDKNKEGTE